MKGQNLRLFLGSTSSNKKPIAKAQDGSIHIAAQTEDTSSKDDDNDWSKIEVVGKSWDGSANFDFDTVTDSGAVTAADIIGYIGTEVFIDFSPASGTNNRTAGTAILGGKAIINDLNITSTNRQKITAAVQFVGNGALS